MSIEKTGTHRIVSEQTGSIRPVGEKTLPGARPVRVGASEAWLTKVRNFLRHRTIEQLVDEGDYQEAIDRIRAELAHDLPPVRTRPHRQLLGEILAFVGQTEEAAQVLRPLLREYAVERQMGKAIAIQKILEDMEVKHEGELDAIAAGAAQTAARIPLFDEFTKEELVAVIRGLRLQRRGTGEVLMFEGEPGASLFLLTDGVVRFFVRGASGWSAQIRELEAPGFFGEISLVHGKPRTATVTCKTVCELLELDRETVAKITAAHPNVQKVLEKFCAEREESPEEQEARRR